MQVGIEVAVDPIPPIPENTRLVPAGTLTFGVEHRVITDDMVDQHYGDDAAKLVDQRPDTIDDSGVSLHVFAADGQREYLRFDCFDDGPHYHYVLPDESYQRVVAFDSVALGDPLEWALDRLRTRLPDMLRAAGGDELAARLDVAEVGEALDEVARLAHEVTGRAPASTPAR